MGFTTIKQCSKGGKKKKKREAGTVSYWANTQMGFVSFL